MTLECSGKQACQHQSANVANLANRVRVGMRVKMRHRGAGDEGERAALRRLGIRARIEQDSGFWNAGAARAGTRSEWGHNTELMRCVRCRRSPPGTASKGAQGAQVQALGLNSSSVGADSEPRGAKAESNVQFKEMSAERLAAGTHKSSGVLAATRRQGHEIVFDRSRKQAAPAGTNGNYSPHFRREHEQIPRMSKINGKIDDEG
ncbi:hypothetical protein B0H17DRAFT_1138037 [Mycena rosella]|uniref:Uncharacterized protein n=1 Tax=Mycena rosella TaxID=1033263 RepID=A0AAD7GA20_MYCRO|nr:hypothetical protein B0H17DRAFT_1138037 [Mycena rosella]